MWPRAEAQESHPITARSTAVVVVAVAIVGAGLSGSNAAEVVSVV
jgi:hypothetical protein